MCRTLYFWGTVIELVLLLITGGISIIPTQSASWAVGALLLVWNIVFQISNNPVCYALLGELPSRRLVLKTINLARVSYKISGLVIGSFNPYMMNP
jgi:MFS transporter, SP family, general alpha glucoside:H+ symporter